MTASFLAILGLLLACSGTYSVVAYLVTQRLREFGIRMALGATVAAIVGNVMRQALRLGMMGAAAGVMVAAGVAQLVATNVEFIKPFGVSPYLCGTAAVIAATVLAGYFPSARAARVDPAASLRTD